MEGEINDRVTAGTAVLQNCTEEAVREICSQTATAFCTGENNALCRLLNYWRLLMLGRLRHTQLSHRHLSIVPLRSRSGNMKFCEL